MNGQVRAVAAKLAHSQRLRVIIFVLVFIAMLLGLLIVPVERMAPGAKIGSYADGVWFAATTVTGVGYGDMYPVTAWGRIIAVILETFGVIMFGSVVAFVSVELSRYQDDFYMKRMNERFDGTEKKLDEMSKRVEFLIKEQKDN